MQGPLCGQGWRCVYRTGWFGVFSALVVVLNVITASQVHKLNTEFNSTVRIANTLTPRYYSSYASAAWL